MGVKLEGVTVPAVEARKRKAINRIRRSGHRRKLVPFLFWYSDDICYRATGQHYWEEWT